MHNHTALTPDSVRTLSYWPYRDRLGVVSARGTPPDLRSGRTAPWAFATRLRLRLRVGLAVCLVVLTASVAIPAEEVGRLAITWQDNFLTITAPGLPGGEIRINYLEAYCRPGSTDRDWGETVIKHTATLIAVEEDGHRIRLLDRLADGVQVEHTISARDDEVGFEVVAHNPTAQDSQVDWAQPCIRVDKFTGTDPADARELFPPYIRRCFLFVDGKLTRLPTEPWAREARYTPGQVYVPAGVDRHDVNPRPLSSIVPSNGLCGCFSADESTIMAVAWEPYQEIFQGVITCIHSDFRIGGLKAGEKKTIRGKIYVVPAKEVDRLVERYQHDFAVP